jgi:hypothetical protein
MTHPLADMPDRPPGRGPSGTAMGLAQEDGLAYLQGGAS